MIPAIRHLSTSMIAERTRNLDTIKNPQYTTSAHKILNTIEENMASCCSNEPCFYLTNVDLGARNAIFDTGGILQAIIDVDTLQFVPIEYAVQVPPGLGLEFFPNNTASVWRADNESRSSHMEDYTAFLFAAGALCEQCNLGAYFASPLEKDSAALIQGFEVVDEEDTNYNDGWLGSESVLRLKGQNSVTDTPNDVQKRWPELPIILLSRVFLQLKRIFRIQSNSQSNTVFSYPVIPQKWRHRSRSRPGGITKLCKELAIKASGLVLDSRLRIFAQALH